jgi:hypothetical protein
MNLYGVPFAVWLTLLASVVVAVLSSATAIIVMWRSNVNSRRNLQQQLKLSREQFQDQRHQESTHFGNQLEHDARQRELEREMSLRRDVYLPAAEAIARAQAALGQLTDIKADQIEIGRQLAIDQGILAKAHLIANESTVNALMNYQKVFMPAYLELVMLRSPLLVKKAAIETHQKFIDKAAAEIERLLQLMKQQNIAGNKDQAAFNRIMDQTKFEQDAHNYHSGKRSAIHKEMALGQMALVERMGELAVNAANLIPHAILSCRQELGLPIDNPDEYCRLYVEQQQAAKAIISEAACRGRELVAAADRDTG